MTRKIWREGQFKFGFYIFSHHGQIIVLSPSIHVRIHFSMTFCILNLIPQIELLFLHVQLPHVPQGHLCFCTICSHSSNWANPSSLHPPLYPQYSHQWLSALLNIRFCRSLGQAWFQSKVLNIRFCRPLGQAWFGGTLDFLIAFSNFARNLSQLKTKLFLYNKATASRLTFLCFLMLDFEKSEL